MKIVRVWIAAFALIASLLTALPVYADTPNPDSTPTVEQFNVWRNVLQTGDFLLVIYANIPYATVPDNPVTDTFIWRLFALDGITELGQTVGYTYNVGTYAGNGYGYNVYSMYFDNTTAPTWGAAYPVKLSGNPTAFITPPSYTFTLSAADYSSLTDSDEVQTELTSRIMTLAADLTTKWGLASTYSLVTSDAAATTLSLYGETFFRGAIRGVQAMAPLAFEYVIGSISVTSRTWNTAYSTNVTNQWSGTWVETAQVGARALFGVGWNIGDTILTLVILVLVIIGSMVISPDGLSATVDAWIALLIMGTLGFTALGYVALIVTLVWAWGSAKVWRVLNV